MASASMELVKNDFAKTVAKMLDKSNQAGALARLYPLYQKLQTNRFMTEGASEGNAWEALNSSYAEYKKRRYGGGPKRSGGSWKSWPGAGTKMLIGTSTLAGAVIGPGSPFTQEGVSMHKAMFTATSMTIVVQNSGTNAEGRPFDYASAVNEKRNFMDFSDASIELMKSELQRLLIGGRS